MPVKSIADAIRDVKPEPAARFIPTRYPYTYAADYLRAHPDIVPDEVLAHDDLRAINAGDGNLSRSDASHVRRVWARMTGVDDMDAAILLADAGLAEMGIAVGRGELLAILAGRRADAF